MLTSYKAYKDILERIEVIITSDELRTSKDVFKFYDELKNKMLSESNRVFQEAFKEALQEYNIEVVAERIVGPEKEPRFIYIFKSKNFYYHLSVNLYTLSKNITVQEFHEPAMKSLEGYTGTFNTVVKGKNIKEVFNSLRDYEKVNDEMVILTNYNKWNGKYYNFLVERSIFDEKVDDTFENGVPKRIIQRIDEELKKNEINSFDADVDFPFKDKIYETNGFKVNEKD